MIEEIKAPIDQVVSGIVGYKDRSGFEVFQVWSFWKNPKTGRIEDLVVSLEDPSTMQGNAYNVTYRWRTDKCTVRDPTSPRYLNGSAVIVELNRGPKNKEATSVTWNDHLRRGSDTGPGYKKLEEIFGKFSK